MADNTLSNALGIIGRELPRWWSDQNARWRTDITPADVAETAFGVVGGPFVAGMTYTPDAEAAKIGGARGGGIVNKLKAAIDPPKARGDRLVGIDRKLRQQLKAGEITQEQWLAGQNQAANEFLDAVAQGFGDPARANKIFSRMGFYRENGGLFRSLQDRNYEIKHGIKFGPESPLLKQELARIVHAGQSGLGDQMTPVQREEAVRLMRAWAGALGYRIGEAAPPPPAGLLTHKE